jgi:hypothetical protein
MHVFVPIKGSRKVKIIDVKAHVLGVGHGEHAVPM